MSIGGFLFRRVADVAMPGSGEVIGIMERLKPLVPYILAILAILFAAWYLHHRGYEAGKAEIAGRYESKMRAAVDREVRATAVLAGADRVLRQQSASIRAQAAAQDEAMDQARKLLAQADKRDIGRRAQIASLQAAAARPVSGAPCKSLPEVSQLWH